MRAAFLDALPEGIVAIAPFFVFWVDDAPQSSFARPFVSLTLNVVLRGDAFFDDSAVRVVSGMKK